MAIDKNFVIKNGLEVNTNVLVAAADEKQVGIGTTRPYYKLHVGGGEGNRGGIGATDITISGIATVGVANSSAGALRILGISTFQGDIDLLGSAGVSTVLWDASENRLEFKDNASIGFGTGNDLTLWHDGSVSYIKDTVGDLRIAGDKITLELEDGTNVKVIDQFGVNITGVTTTNRLLVSGVSTFTSVGSNLIPDTDGSRSIGAATSEWQDLFIDGTAKIDTLTVDESATVAVDVTVGTGVTLQRHGGVSIAGITTVGGNLLAGGDILPDNDGERDLGSASKEFQDLFIDGTANIDTLAADTAAIGDLTDNRVVIAGSSGELEDDANFTYDGVGLNIGAGSGVTVSNTGNITAAGIVTANSGVQVGTSATISSTGNAAFAGIVTANGGINVGTAVTVDAETGNVAISGITTIGGNLYVTGDIVYDEITGRNLNITGLSTFADDVLFKGATSGRDITFDQSNNSLFFADDARLKFGNTSAAPDLIIQHTSDKNFIEGSSSGSILHIRAKLNEDQIKLHPDGPVELCHNNVKIFQTTGIGITVGLSSVQHNGNAAFAGIVTANGGVKVGTAVTLHANGNLGITGILTAGRFIGIHTSTDGGGVGIASTTAHVAYGVTYIDFKGPGVSTVYYSAVTGVSTVYFQGGGDSSVGAAGTWQNDGAPGISTAKSVGVNTNSINDGDLQGRPYVGAAGSFQGLYIGNGMVVNDNQLNGDHYIGTAFGGMMVGPVTINGVLTVDGNYAVL